PTPPSPSTQAVVEFAPSAREPRHDDTARGTSRRNVALALGGLGLAGIAVGASFGALAANDFNSAERDPALCPKDVCSPLGRQRVNTGYGEALASTLAFGVGVAAAAAAVVVVVTA